MDKLIPLMRGMPPVFRPVLDGVTFPANPFDPAAPAGAGVDPDHVRQRCDRDDAVHGR